MAKSSKPSDEELKDWMLEKFPSALKWRCKAAASRKMITLKEFVKISLLKAVEDAEIGLGLNSSQRAETGNKKGKFLKPS